LFIVVAIFVVVGVSYDSTVVALLERNHRGVFHRDGVMCVAVVVAHRAGCDCFSWTPPRAAAAASTPGVSI
jgi:hypothetical protein